MTPYELAQKCLCLPVIARDANDQLEIQKIRSPRLIEIDGRFFLPVGNSARVSKILGTRRKEIIVSDGRRSVNEYVAERLDKENPLLLVTEALTSSLSEIDLSEFCREGNGILDGWDQKLDCRIERAVIGRLSNTGSPRDHPAKSIVIRKSRIDSFCGYIGRIEFNSCRFGLFSFKGSGEIAKCHIRFLVASSNSDALRVIDSRLNLLIFEDLTKLTNMQFKSSSIDYSFETIADFFRDDTDPIRAEIAGRWTQKLRTHFHFQSDLLRRAKTDNPSLRAENIRVMMFNTYSALSEHQDLKHSDDDIARYGHYLASRNSRLNRALFWFHGAYFNIWKPLLLALCTVLGIFVTMACTMPDYPLTSNAKYLVNPIDLFRYVILDGLDFRAALSLPKLVLSILALLLPYPVFCFAVGLRRRFGFSRWPFRQSPS